MSVLYIYLRGIQHTYPDAPTPGKKEGMLMMKRKAEETNKMAFSFTRRNCMNHDGATSCSGDCDCSLEEDDDDDDDVDDKSGCLIRDDFDNLCVISM
jgi:hypothetical protein